FGQRQPGGSAKRPSRSTAKQKGIVAEVAPEGLSLSKPAMLAKIDEEGVNFRSHLDGSLHRFTPQSSLNIQHQLGADIILSFDEGAPHTASQDYARAPMDRTHRWAVRGLHYHRQSGQPHQFLYGIVQGGQYQPL